jgi:hypothetical protein
MHEMNRREKGRAIVYDDDRNPLAIFRQQHRIVGDVYFFESKFKFTLQTLQELIGDVAEVTAGLAIECNEMCHQQLVAHQPRQDRGIFEMRLRGCFLSFAKFSRRRKE